VSTLELVVEAPDGRREERCFRAGEPIWLGRDPQCDLVLDSHMVSRHHARIAEIDGELLIRDQSVNGTEIDGSVLHHQGRSLPPHAVVKIGPFRLLVRARAKAIVVAASHPRPGASSGAAPELRRLLHRKLLDHLDLARVDPKSAATARLRPAVAAALERICRDHGQHVGDDDQCARLVAELTDEAVAFGPLTGLLADPSVTEIMVVDPRTIYVERAGVLEETALHFTDDDAVRATIERIVTPIGRRIDESSPLVDARLPDGSRVNAIIPPLASRGPCITIRKPPSRSLTLDDLVAAGSLDKPMADFLTAAVRARKNVVISGGTGSGKTTLLNVLSAAIPERERIVTIEDAAELQLRQRHVVGLEARPPNVEGKGAFSIRDLVKNALRMRPDRIVVGECRGGEALDMLQAMNTGHEGSMTTTHANSPREAVTRLETLCLMAGLELPVAAIRQQLASSIHLIVQQSRAADGARRITSITEVVGLDPRGAVELHELFTFLPAGREAAAFRSTGYLATFAAELEARQHDTPDGSAAVDSRS
jgi:pilus assembly protein CpaF